MSSIDPRLRSWLVWALPFVGVALLLAWETDWGRELKRVPPLESNVVASPVNVALLPEYKVDGGVDGNRETVERTLFNPTRRPAPPAVAVAAKPTMQKGQFVLTGTTVVDQKATAFLREVSGGKSRRVSQGETVNGMIVAEVLPDRVKLKLNDDVEELVMKAAPGPRTTTQPASPQVAGQPGGPVPGAAPQNAQQQAGQQAAPVQDVADVLANRRRAARAAEAAAAQGAQGTQGTQGTQPAPQPQAAPAGAARPGDPAWNEVYQRYMQPRK